MADEINDILNFDPMRQQQTQTQETEAPVEQQSNVSDILKFDTGAQKPRSYGIGTEFEKDPNSWREAVVMALQNIPSDSWEFAKNMTYPVRHFKTFVKGTGKMIKGAAEKIKPGEQENEKYFNALVETLENNYGSVEGFRNYVANHPVQASADVSTVLMPVFKLLEESGVIGARTAKITSTIGSAFEPFNMAKRIASLPFKLVPEAVPIKMYERAVKFLPSLSQADRVKVIKTAINTRNQIMPTANGMKKLHGMIDNYNKRISELVNAYDGKDFIPVERLYKGLDDIKNVMKTQSDEPAKIESAFKALKKQWEEAEKISPVRTPSQVQKIKQRIYKDLQTMYEKHKSSPARAELRLHIAENAKKALEDIIPEIKQLNKEDGDLLELMKAIETRANAITNRDLINIGIPVKMGTLSGVGFVLGGQQGAAIGSSLGLVLGIYDLPQVKAKMAIVLNKLRQQGIAVRPTTTAMRLGLYQVGKASEIGDQENEPTIGPQSTK